MMEGGVWISRRMARWKTTPRIERTRPLATKSPIVLATVRRTISGCLAPAYCATRTVAAMVRPVTKATRRKITGKLTETAARASLPRKRPTQMLSTVL